MRTVFFGTPDWAVPSLRALLDASGVDVGAVVTNPDRPSGRGMELTPSPVKRAAQDAGVTVLQPASARDPELRSSLDELAPDVAVVVAYGRILPRALLDVPPLGFVNVHFSLLPSYRGAAPVQRALMDGVTETGVSIMVLTEGMDEGPVLARAATAVDPDESAGRVGDRLARVGADLLVPSLHGYAEGHLTAVPQDDRRASYAPKISGEEARIVWAAPARRVRDHVRALDPAPGAWTMLDNKRLRVFKVGPIAVESLPPDLASAPGSVAIARDGALVAATGDGPVAILEAQAPGKRRMGGAELARGLRPTPGSRFE